jgi:hypothetical protein
MAYMTPKQFLASKGLKVTEGMTLNPTDLGMPPHPQYGTLPEINVTKAENGVFVEGTAACIDCGTQIVIHAGDWFQKRRCEKDQKRNQRRNANPPLSEEVKAARLAERSAKKAVNDEKKALEKATKAQARAEQVRVKAEEKATKIREEAEARAAKLVQAAFNTSATA